MAYDVVGKIMQYETEGLSLTGQSERGEDMTAKTAQFTQGPWVVKSTDEDINTKTIIDSEEFWIAKVLNFNRASDDIRESQANANLLAAAPAMYEALSELVKYLREQVADEALDTWGPVFKAEKALAQAEGKH